MSLHSREKKSSSTHQNTDTGFPNQETLTSHLYNPTNSEEPHNKEEQQTVRIQKGQHKQQYKQDEKAEEYPADKGTG